MEDGFAGRVHLTETALERYAMDGMREPETAPLKEHLLVCSSCRRCLAGTRAFIKATRRALLKAPVNLVHQTEDGPIRLEVRKSGRSRWLARHWGKELDGGWEFPTMEEANEWNLQSFAEMFPEHGCTRECRLLPKDVYGDPDRERVCTSDVERQNPTARESRCGE